MALMQAFILKILLIALIAPSIVFALNNVTVESGPQAAKGLLTVGHQTVPLSVEVAKTSQEMEMGLRFRAEIPQDYIMLYVLNTSSAGFWTKDMRFPLDIIWLSKNGTVVDVLGNAQPCSQDCQTYFSTMPAQYVIEAKAGFIDRFSIHAGSVITLIEKSERTG